MDWQEQEMIDGYLEGLNPHAPEPSGNRTACYAHGFANGRDDLRRSPREKASELRKRADEAMAADLDRSH